MTKINHKRKAPLDASGAGGSAVAFSPFFIRFFTPMESEGRFRGDGAELVHGGRSAGFDFRRDGFNLREKLFDEFAQFVVVVPEVHGFVDVMAEPPYFAGTGEHLARSLTSEIVTRSESIQHPVRPVNIFRELVQVRLQTDNR